MWKGSEKENELEKKMKYIHVYAMTGMRIRANTARLIVLKKKKNDTNEKPFRSVCCARWYGGIVSYSNVFNCIRFAGCIFFCCFLSAYENRFLKRNETKRRDGENINITWGFVAVGVVVLAFVPIESYKNYVGRFWLRFFFFFFFTFSVWMYT